MIIIEKPPVYDRIIKAGLQPRKGTIYTYGDNIYNPDNIAIPLYLTVHEGVHIKQQAKIGKDKWWDKYLEDDREFMLSQELEAYGKQYKLMCSYIKDRNEQARLLLDIAMTLASPMYGSVISVSEAIKKLK